MRFQRGLQYFSWTVASIRVFSFFFFSFLFSLTHVHALNNIFDLCLQNYKLLQIHMHNTCFALWNTKLQPSKTTSVFFNYLAWDLVHNPKWSGYVIFSVDRCHMNRFTRTLISLQCRWLICFIKVLWTASPSFKGRRWFFLLMRKIPTRVVIFSLWFSLVTNRVLLSSISTGQYCCIPTKCRISLPNQLPPLALCKLSKIKVIHLRHNPSRYYPLPAGGI